MSLIALTPEQTGIGGLSWDTALSRVVLCTDNNPFTVTEVIMGASVKKTADQRNTTVILADISGLSFAVLDGTYYAFRFLIPFRSVATTTGLVLALTIPSVTTFTATARIPVTADGTGGERQGWITSSGDEVVGEGVEATGTDYLAIIEGMILPSADGTLQAQFRSEVNTSAVTVRQGACGFIVAY